MTAGVPPGGAGPARVPVLPEPGGGPAAPAMIDARGLSRTFGHGDTAVPALRGVSFTVPQGQLAALCGRSGSGKTTLLNIVGGLDIPTAGTVTVAGQEVTGLSERERTVLRRTDIAFIFQSFGLIPMLSAAENVGIPLRITGTSRRERDERVAIARALAGRPRLLIADEPTGQLDSETGQQIMRLLQAVVRSEGVTALVATHDEQLMDLAGTVLRLDDGALAPA